jgi:hypothetical protein
VFKKEPSRRAIIHFAMKYLSLNNLLTILFIILYTISSHAKSTTKSTPTKSKSSAAIPRSKQSKPKSIFSVFGSGIMQRVAREVKSSFSSEMESLTLQVSLFYLATCCFSSYIVLIAVADQTFRYEHPFQESGRVHPNN